MAKTQEAKEQDEKLCQAIQDAWRKLSTDEQEYLLNVIDPLYEAVKAHGQPFGEMSVIEFIGKLGIFLLKHEVRHLEPREETEDNRFCAAVQEVLRVQAGL